MEPKITTNPFKLKASEFAGVYFLSLIRKLWFIFLPVLGILLGSLIYNTIKYQSTFTLIPFGMFTFFFIRARYQFIRKLKRSPGIERLRFMKVYEHCIEIVDEEGNETPFYLVDIEKIVPLRKYYQVILKTRQSAWIPKGYFKTPEDQLAFESHLRTKGKMK